MFAVIQTWFYISNANIPILTQGQHFIKWVVALKESAVKQLPCSQTKDVKAGAPLFNHRILGEWMLLPIIPHCSPALFQRPCFPFSSLEKGGEGWLADMHLALPNTRMILHNLSTFFRTWIFPFLHAVIDLLLTTLSGDTNRCTSLESL